MLRLESQAGAFIVPPAFVAVAAVSGADLSESEPSDEQPCSLHVLPHRRVEGSTEALDLVFAQNNQRVFKLPKALCYLHLRAYARESIYEYYPP